MASVNPGKSPGMSVNPSSSLRQSVVFGPSFVGPAFVTVTAGPDRAGDFTLAIATAVDPANDVWQLTWATPADAVSAPAGYKLYHQLRYMAGSDVFTAANFVASGSVHGSYQLGSDEADWLVDLQPAGYSGNYYVVCPTATPAPASGAAQFGLLYKNTFGIEGALATASATL
jgi:hypothetical protein